MNDSVQYLLDPLKAQHAAELAKSAKEQAALAAELAKSAEEQAALAAEVAQLRAQLGQKK
jgi:regulator of replication initiation timing